MDPRDIVVLLRIIDLKAELWTLESLASDLSMTSREVYEAIERMHEARLMSFDRRSVFTRALSGFLLYGLPFIRPARLDLTRKVRGIPTAFASPLLTGVINQRPPLTVWEYEQGTHEGNPVKGLVPDCAELSMKFPGLYGMLSLYDCFVVGRAREKQLAKDKIDSRFSEYARACSIYF